MTDCERKALWEELLTLEKTIDDLCDELDKMDDHCKGDRQNFFIVNSAGLISMLLLNPSVERYFHVYIPESWNLVSVFIAAIITLPFTIWYSGKLIRQDKEKTRTLDQLDEYLVREEEIKSLLEENGR